MNSEEPESFSTIPQSETTREVGYAEIYLENKSKEKQNNKKLCFQDMVKKYFGELALLTKDLYDEYLSQDQDPNLIKSFRDIYIAATVANEICEYVPLNKIQTDFDTISECIKFDSQHDPLRLLKERTLVVTQCLDLLFETLSV